MKYIPLLLIISFLFGCYGIDPEKTGLEGKEIPSFKLLLQDSVTYLDSKAIQNNKPTVLFYYGPHCPYSRAQMEEIIENIGILKKSQLVLITGAPFNEMRKFYTHYHIGNYKNIVAGMDYNHFLKDYFKITGVPFTAIYNGDRKLVAAFTGKIYVKQILSIINQ